MAHRKELDIEIEGWFTRLMGRMLEALESVGGMATAEALALVAGTYRTHSCRALKRLEALGKVAYEDGQLIPGRGQGRSLRLYRITERRVGSVWEKIKALIRSQMIAEMAARGYQFLRYDKAKDEMEFRERSGNERSVLVVVIDDPESPVEALAARMLRVEKKKVMAIGAVTLATRESKLRRLLAGRSDRVATYNVVEGRKDRGRNVSDRAQKATARRVTI